MTQIISGTYNFIYQLDQEKWEFLISLTIIAVLFSTIKAFKKPVNTWAKICNSYENYEDFIFRSGHRHRSNAHTVYGWHWTVTNNLYKDSGITNHKKIFDFYRHRWLVTQLHPIVFVVLSSWHRALSRGAQT